jgi:hypothetical protein
MPDEETMSETTRTDPAGRTGPTGTAGGGRDPETGGRTPVDPRTGETAKERVDRELIELLNELRVILPGIQVLFAFLLTVPFSQRFAEVNGPEKFAYFVAVLCTAAATVTLITVPNYHRITFRQATKERLLRVSNVLALVGTALLGVAIVAVLFLITDFLYDGAGVGVVTVVAALVIAWLWFVMPINSRARHSPSDTAQGPDNLT